MEIDKIKQAYTSSKITSSNNIVVPVCNLEDQDIWIQELKDGKLWTYIYYDGKDKKRRTYSKIEKGRLINIVFISCKNSRIMILDSVLRITLLMCENCQISTRNELCGPLEIFKSRKINADIRTNHSFVQTDLSEAIHFYQRVPEIIYIVGTECSNIKGIVLESGLEKIIKIPMDDPKDTSLYLFSRKAIYKMYKDTDDLILIDKKGDEDSVKSVTVLGFSPVDN